MSLMGDKVFKYILKFSLRFTEWSYELFAFTNLILSFKNLKTSYEGYDVDKHLKQ